LKPGQIIADFFHQSLIRRNEDYMCSSQSCHT